MVFGVRTAIVGPLDCYRLLHRVYLSRWPDWARLLGPKGLAGEDGVKHPPGEFESVHSYTGYDEEAKYRIILTSPSADKSSCAPRSPLPSTFDFRTRCHLTIHTPVDAPYLWISSDPLRWRTI